MDAGEMFVETDVNEPRSPIPMSEPALPRTRAEVAEFMFRNREVILRRIRNKLSAARSARAMTDTEDLFSSMVRRLDGLAAADSLRAAMDAQLWTLALKTARNLVLEKYRVAARLRRLQEDERGPLRRPEESPLRKETGAAELECVLSSLADDADRELLLMKLAGLPVSALAARMGVGVEVAWQRWSRLCRRLRGRAEPKRGVQSRPLPAE